jgi:4-hydroxybenzoate polyprenyltransferase
MTEPPPNSRLLAFWQLLRAGNVFTAISNVIAGFLIVRGVWAPGDVLCTLVAASALLYEAGMVLNDAFDAELDAVERPERPIPSGRIARGTALGIGWMLLADGLACAAAASWITASAGPLVVGACLAVTVVMYNGGLKATWAGPWAMGWCRTLNVLLGASVADNLSNYPVAWAYAAGIGLYTVALTYIARSEASGSPDDALRRRRFVKRMILGFIVIDAIAATFAGGWPSGLAVLCLMLPSQIAARWAPMT